MAQPNPLHALTRLGPALYLRPPPAPRTTPLATNAKHTSAALALALPPTTIILCAWFAAKPAHLARYIAAYTALYPSARLLVALSTPADAIYRPYAAQQSRLQPAVDAVRADVAASRRADATLHVHALSNGGAHTACQIARAWRRSGAGGPLPAKALVLESCPGTSTFAREVEVIRLALGFKNPALQVVGLVGICVFLVLLHAVMFVLRQVGIVEGAWRDLLDRELVRDENRTYIYGGRDELVFSAETETHAREAAALGYNVRREKFQEGRHVANVLVDPERYWRIVKETWEAD